MGCLLNGNTIEYWAVKQTGPCDGVPTTPVWTNIRRVDGSLSRVPTFVKSNETDPTRQAGASVLTQFSVEGSFNGEFPIADTGLHMLIESAMQNTFSADLAISAATISFDNASSEIRDSANGFTNVVAGQFIGVWDSTTVPANNQVYLVTSKTSNGVLVVSPAPSDQAAGDTIQITGQNVRNAASEVGLSVQKRTAHEAGTEYLTFSDCQVNTMSIGVAASSLLTVGYSFLGRNLEDGTAQIAGATDNALSSAKVIGSVAGVPTTWIDGTIVPTTTQTFTDMSVEIDNGGSQNYGVSSSGSAGISWESISVTGTWNSFVDKTDATTLASERTKADNQTAFDIGQAFKDTNGNYLVIRRPSTIYTSFDQPESGNGTSVINTGAVDSEGKTYGYTIQFTYIPNPNA